MKRVQLAGYKAAHFDWQVSGKVATITINRPERKNPLTLESYGELRDLFHELAYAADIKAMVATGAGGNFCSGGDVHDTIGKLVKMDMTEMLAFTRMTGDLVKAMRACPQPIVAAIDGVCTGAGAMADKTFLDWPFFDEAHRMLARELEAWTAREFEELPHDDLDRATRGRALRARRRKNLDLERRHRRLLLRVRPHRRGAGRAGPQRVGGRRRLAGARLPLRTRSPGRDDP